MCDIELRLEATDGETFSIPLDTAELERANRVRITFKGEDEEKALVIVQFCAHGERCPVVETPGVSLSIQQRTLTLQCVSSNYSGLYEAIVFIGNHVSKIRATLVNSEYVIKMFPFYLYQDYEKKIICHDCAQKVLKMYLMLFLLEPKGFVTFHCIFCFHKKSFRLHSSMI